MSAGNNTTTTLNLIAVLIGLFGQYGPSLVKEISDLIHGNPQQAGETDMQYLIRLNALIEAKLADADANAQAVIGGVTSPAQPPSPVVS